MKRNISYIIIFILIIALVVPFSACTKDNKDNNQPPVYDDRPIYNVAFNIGLDAIGSAPSIENLHDGDSVTIPNYTISKEGYTFLGWMKANDEKVYQAGETITINGDAVAFEAVFELTNPILVYTTAMDDVSLCAVSSYEGKIKNANIPATNNGKKVFAIGVDAFKDCLTLESVTATTGLLEIGENAFANCTKLTSVNLPTTITSIGGSAFAGCTALENITLPNGLVNISNGLFENCNNLTSVTLSSGIIVIGDKAFNKCEKLESITLPDGVQVIGTYAFGSCFELTSITLTSSVTTISDYAFYSCSKLSTINFDGTKEQWNAISKESYWKNGITGTLTVVCNDGNLEI